MKQEVCLKPFWCIPQAVASRKTTHVIVPFANEITCFFHLTSFLFGNLIDKLRLFRHEHLAGILSKMRKVSLLHAGKQYTAFVANDKIQAFMWNSRFSKNCIQHCELNSFPIFEDFSDEIGGDVNASELFDTG